MAEELMHMAAAAGQNADIGLICDAAMFRRCVTADAWAALNAGGQAAYLETDAPSSWDEAPPPDPDLIDRVVAFAANMRILVIGPGAPRFDAALLARLPGLEFLGELEGDRFAQRVDLDYARARGIRVVDTTNGSSYPVSEWALCLLMIGLRGASDLYRRMIAGEVLERDWLQDHVSFRNGELTGKRIGIIGCGHIGRRLIQLLAPFHTENLVYDPYIAPVLAEVLDLHLVGLNDLFARCDAVICTLPLTPETDGLIGAAQFDLMPRDAVFVNVSRGRVVDTAALVARLERGDLWAGLDVLEPESPIPVDHPVRHLPNVFVTPHIAGVTAACGPRFVTLMADEIRRFNAGEATRTDLVSRSELAAGKAVGRR